MPRLSRRRIERAFEDGDRDAITYALGFDPGRAVIDASKKTGASTIAAIAADATGAASPRLALARALDLARAFEIPPENWHAAGRRALVRTLGASEAIARYLAARPELARPLVDGRHVQRAKTPEHFRDELRRLRAGSDSEDDFAARLRTYRTREWIRIVARELSRTEDVSTILAELSDLAEAIIDCATRYHIRRDRSANGPAVELDEDGPRPAAFCVVAQGKLGARELNVSSDVDLQFFYSRGRATDTEAAALHQRLTALCHGITATLATRTAEGFCYRVDLDLRPEGTKGPVINSLAAAETYYETWGQSWERLALIRARHAGGSRWLTENFLRTVRPWVFPKNLDLATIDDIRRLKDRVETERRTKAARRGAAAGIDVKRDAGLIREIELFVQILQVLGGGRNPAVRSAELADALDRLRFAGAVGERDHRHLREAYLFFRRVENALQAIDERQTHVLPETGELPDLIGRLLNPRQAQNPGAWLLGRVERERRRVQRITQRLFSDQPAAPTNPDIASALSGDDAGRVAALERLGFDEPGDALGALTALQRGAGGPFSEHATERLRQLAAPLLESIAAAPDPDQALRLYAELDVRLRKQSAYYQWLEAPSFRRRLIDLLGTSEFLSATILRYPDLLDWLDQATDPDALGRPIPVEALSAQLDERLGALEDVEVRLRAIRRFKLRQTLRIGLLDLAGTLELDGVLRQLSDLAEASLRGSVRVARDDLGPRLSLLRDRGFAVLGLGRLGSREMGYGSDLDLIFLYDDEGGPDTREDAVRLAQRLIQHINYRPVEGALYAIDTRLRPSGNQGPIVTTAAGFVAYHRERAMLWERQALLRARPVAGDLELGERALAALDDVRYPESLPPEAAAEIHRVRQRMETEIAQETDDLSNVKTGRGGLTDITFLSQYLVLCHASRQPLLRTTSTRAQLNGLLEAELLPRRDASALLEAFQFLRFLENRLRMVHDRPIDAVSKRGSAMALLARRMGYAGRRAGERLGRDYARTTKTVRRIYAEVMGLGGEN